MSLGICIRGLLVLILVFFFGTEVALTNLCSYGFGYRGLGRVGEGSRIRGGVGGVSRSFLE